MKEESDKEEKNVETKMAQKKNMQYPFDMDTLIAGIEEINPIMPSRWNFGLLKRDTVLNQCRKDFTK